MCQRSAGDPHTVRILGISGSLRRGSYNTALLRQARELIGGGQAVELWLGLSGVPPFNEDHEANPPTEVETMRSRIMQADAVLFATPEYNTTVPGQLKNALDWVSRPAGQGVLAGMPVAVVSASQSGYGGQRSQQTLREVLAACGAYVIGDPLAIPYGDKAFTADSRLIDATHRDALADVLRELDAAARFARAEAV